MTATEKLLDELKWRGLLYQCTDGLGDALGTGGISAYAGFDPSASSLHVGNLIPVMGLVHLQRHGHRPVVLVGGGTGMIGDPSGKTAERQLNSEEVVEANSAGLRQQLERFLDFSDHGGARMLNNAEWLLPMRAVSFMRDVGKHFSINVMLAKESVRSRIETGISYTEFSYMLLQAYDYLELFRRHGVTLQIGGSDQWGNIVAGIDLIRKTEGAATHALTLPLVTTAAGAKFGKTEAGSVWLDPDRTSPYRFYQFWINTDDRDVGRYMRYFTLLGSDEILALEGALQAAPERREAQARLAGDVTARVHGADAARTSVEMSQLLFGGADPTALSPAALKALAGEIPFLEYARPSEGQVDLFELMTAGKLAQSKGAARRLLEQGGVYINGRRAAADDRQLREGDALHDGHVLLRKGARDYLLVRLS